MASILKTTRLAPMLRAYTVQRSSVYIIGERAMTNFKDKERGEETVHFRKADEELLRKLLQKVTTSCLSATHGLGLLYFDIVQCIADLY